MATFTVTHAQRVDGIAVFQTLENTDITIGQTIVVTNVGNGFNGTFIVQAVPTYYFIGVGATTTTSQSLTSYSSSTQATMSTVTLCPARSHGHSHAHGYRPSRQLKSS